MSRGHLIFLIPFVFFLLAEKIFSQGMGISESSITPDASAILELRSTLRGLLIPRMNNAQRATLASTAVQGLLVYDTQDNLFYYYNGGWQAIFAGSLPLGVSSGGTGLSSVAQGDILFGSAANTLSVLAKNTTATRYLSNTGSSNNPAWAQVDLSDGVTGNLPIGNLNSGTGASSSTFWRGDGTWGTPAGTGVTAVTGSGNIASSGGTTPDITFTGILPVANGGTGLGTFGGTNTLLYTTSANTLSSIATANGGVLNTDGTGAPFITATPILGSAGSVLGTLSLSGNTSGTITIQPQAAAGTYNFNLPASAGSSGQILQSGGGGGTAMIWSIPTYPSASGTAGKLLRSNGTDILYSTATYPNTIVQGEILYGSAADVISNLPVGTAGQILETNGAGADPSWTTLGGVASITANAAATNATTFLTGATWTMPANTATAGMVIKLRCNYRFVKTVAPPTLTCRLRVAGANVATFVITSVSSAATSGGYIEGYVTIRTIGAGGTLMSSLNGNNNHGITNATNWNPTSTNIATSAINTTLATTILLDMRMNTAVAGNTLTISQGWVEVVKP